MEHNFEKLKEYILSLSNAKDFKTACKEWEWDGVEIDGNMTHCPCGQPIKEKCFIHNTENGNRTFVGNVCINRFMGMDTGQLFSGLKRIIKKIDANPNTDLIHYAKKFGYIFANEYSFLMDTRTKRDLSTKQLDWKRKINRRIINKTVVNAG